MKIPADSLYFLLCYAWDVLDARDVVNLGAVPSARPLDLLASVLTQGVRRLLRKGLDRGYVGHADAGPCIRGKLDVSTTLARCLHRQARAAFTTDEFTEDVLSNQVLKGTLASLTRVDDLHPELRDEAANLVGLLRGVCLPSDVRALSRRVQLHRNNACYGLLLCTCELIARNLVMTRGEVDGRWKFQDFTGDDREMGHVFEAFVRNFLRREQRRFKVLGEQWIPWDVDPGESKAHLPRMRTDTVLVAADHRIVIETKCATKIWQVHRGGRSISSSHLYQLFAYLGNGEGGGPLARTASGLLLYAGDAETVDVRTGIRGHRVHVRSLLLAQPWEGVVRDLRAIIGDIDLAALGT